jgi:hypothetical protein
MSFSAETAHAALSRAFASEIARLRDRAPRNSFQKFGDFLIE